MALARTDGCAIIAIGAGYVRVHSAATSPYIASDAPEMLAGRDPPAWLHAKYAQVDRITLRAERSGLSRSPDPVSLPLTISPASNSSGRLELLTSTSRLTCAPSLPHDRHGMPPNQPLHVSRFRDHDVSRPQPFIQSQKFPRRIALRRDHGKHSQIAAHGSVPALCSPAVG